MHSLAEVLLPFLVSILALIPLAVLVATYRRTHGGRILLSALAFLGIVAKGAVMFALFLTDRMTGEILEWTEFTADFAIMSLFAASFVPGLASRTDEDGRR